jgi:hypothetical protein
VATGLVAKVVTEKSATEPRRHLAQSSQRSSPQSHRDLRRGTEVLAHAPRDRHRAKRGAWREDPSQSRANGIRLTALACDGASRHVLVGSLWISAPLRQLCALLGARGLDLAALVLKQIRTVLLAGMVPDLALEWGLGQALKAFLVGVTPTDWRVYLSMCALLAAVAFIAALVPARRAMRVDPISALRHE